MRTVFALVGGRNGGYRLRASLRCTSLSLRLPRTFAPQSKNP